MGRHAQHFRHADGKFHCPHCTSAFGGKWGRQSLGLHMRGKHSDAAKHAPTTVVQRITNRGEATKHNLACPECGDRHSTPQGLGRHRRAAHGIAGKNAKYNSKYARLKYEREHNLNHEHEEEHRHDPQQEWEAGFRDGIAVGHIQNYLDSIAESAGIPAEEFTHRVAGILQRRKTVR